MRGRSNSRLSTPRPARISAKPGPGTSGNERIAPARMSNPPPMAMPKRRQKRIAGERLVLPAGGVGSSAAKEDPVGGVTSLFDIAVVQIVQMQQQLGPFGRGYLDARQHPPVVRTVIAIVEQADVPA